MTTKGTRPPTTADEIREATREAHQVLKDLRLERRALADDLAAAKRDVNAMIEKAACAEMNRLAGATSEAIKGATDAVYARFDRVANILLGKERGNGEPRDTPGIEALTDAADVLKRAGTIRGARHVDIDGVRALVVEL